MTDDRPLCKCHGEPMSRNVSNGRLQYRCAVKAREAAARKRARHRERIAERERERYAAQRETILVRRKTPEQRHRAARWQFSQRARRYAHVYARRAERLGTDGDALIPLRYLWYPVPEVVEFLDARLGDDLPEMLREAGLDDVWQHTLRRGFVNFAKCDRICARLGLHVDRIDTDPMFSIGPPVGGRT